MTDLDMNGEGSTQASSGPLLHTDDVTIVLVRPARETNIGATARAMKTMGFRRLVLVSPEVAIGSEARAVAHGSVDVLEGARITDDLGEAVQGCGVTAGFTAREGRDRMAPLKVRKFVHEVLPRYLPAKVALVFGSEESGLSIADLEHCQFSVRIPTGEEHHSLNLSHAVMVGCYELHEAMTSYGTTCSPGVAVSRYDADSSPADALEGGRDAAREQRMQNVYRGVESFLERIGYPNMSSRARAMADVRRVLGATHLTQRDANTLLGLFRHVRYLLRHGKAPAGEESC